MDIKFHGHACFELSDGDVTVRDAFMDMPRGLRSQLDASLQWSGGGQGPRPVGDRPQQA